MGCGLPIPIPLTMSTLVVKALACEGASEFNCHLSTGLVLFQAHNLAFFYKVLKRILFPWLGQL